MFGVDCSHHQGVIHFGKLIISQPPVQFVYFKCSQGVGYTDPMLKINSNSAESVGLPFGYYHFASLGTKNIVQDAKAEAQYFLSVVRQMPSSRLPLVLDIEDDKGVHQYGLSKNDVLGWIESFFDTLKQAGFDDYALYSYTPFLKANLPDKHNLGRIKLWIAQYTNSLQPAIPSQWKDWWMWQYSDRGSVSGITGKVDLNRTKYLTL